MQIPLFLPYCTVKAFESNDGHKMANHKFFNFMILASDVLNN